MLIRYAVIGLLIMFEALSVATCSSPRPARVARNTLGMTRTPPANVQTATATRSAATATATRSAATATPHTNDAVPNPALVANENCIVCHDLHPASVVAMEHERHPRCNSCHSGSPFQIGCPSCHSMHRIEAGHPMDPNLGCETCHAVVP